MSELSPETIRLALVGLILEALEELQRYLEEELERKRRELNR